VCVRRPWLLCGVAAVCTAMTFSSSAPTWNIAQAFQGRHGRAFLFKNVYALSPPARPRTPTCLAAAMHMPAPRTRSPARGISQPRGLPALRAAVTRQGGARTPRRVNVTLGPKEERLLMTGLHTVADIFCINCQALLGWTYVRAPPTRPAACPPSRPAACPAAALRAARAERGAGRACAQVQALEEQQKYKAEVSTR